MSRGTQITVPDDALLPDRLQALWRAVEAGALTAQEYSARHEQGLEKYRELWREALRLPGQSDLTVSLLDELSGFTGVGRDEVERRCRNAVNAIAAQWRAQVDATSRTSVEKYYDGSEGYLYDLMWWHSLELDDSPLGYVTALDFAQRRGCRSYLDFGSGVGAGAVLFARHGLEVALGDISSTLLRFSRWRLARRRQSARYIDLKQETLPKGSFDIITAMDVFEHLVDPVAAIDTLHSALRPGGYLFGRFHGEIDESHPQHIVLDFGPTFERLRELDFLEVWRDGWLWGHQVFQKRGSP